MTYDLQSSACWPVFFREGWQLGGAFYDEAQWGIGFRALGLMVRVSLQRHRQRENLVLNPAERRNALNRAPQLKP